MKRQITTDRPQALKGPAAPKAHEQELARFASFMVSEISQRFRNGVFGELNKSTIAKFSDAQVGNYAAIYLKLAAQVTRRLIRQFDDKRIKDHVTRILRKVDKRNREGLYAAVERSIGLSTTELTNTEGLRAETNALILETTQWVKKLRDDTLEMYTANSLRAMTQGSSLADIMKQFSGLVEKRKNHAKFTARNQIANFNSMSTKLRAQNLGITQAKWVTSKDGKRVRDSHADRDGKEFDLTKGLYSAKDGLWLLPGTDYLCRCDYELIIPEAE